MAAYLSIEISLKGTKPRVWRRFYLRKSATLEHLHLAIQDACGWQNGGLFAFTQGRRHLPLAGTFSPVVAVDALSRAQKVRVDRVLGPGGTRRARYHYQPGSRWEVDVQLVAEVDLPERFFRRLVAGRRAFPLEDFDGLEDYERARTFLESGRDPWKEDPEALADFLGHWDPGTFMLDVVAPLFEQRSPRPHPLLIPIRARHLNGASAEKAEQPTLSA
jgi:hypothetical protein